MLVVQNSVVLEVDRYVVIGGVGELDVGGDGAATNWHGNCGRQGNRDWQVGDEDAVAA